MDRVSTFALNYHTTWGQPCATWVMDTLYIIVFSFEVPAGYCWAWHPSVSGYQRCS